MGLKVFLFFFFSSTWSFSSQEQRVVSNAEIAQKLALYQKIATLSATFKQTKHLVGMGIEMHSEGELELTRPGKVVWKITQPGFTELVLDGTHVTMTSGKGSSRQVEQFSMTGALEASVSKSLLSLIAWLKVDIPAIEDAYTITGIGTNTYKCTPKDPTHAVFQSLSFYLHPKGYLESLSIEEKSGDSIDIHFSTPTVTFQK